MMYPVRCWKAWLVLVSSCCWGSSSAQVKVFFSSSLWLKLFLFVTLTSRRLANVINKHASWMYVISIKGWRIATFGNYVCNYSYSVFERLVHKMLRKWNCTWRNNLRHSRRHSLLTIAYVSENTIQVDDFCSSSIF